MDTFATVGGVADTIRRLIEARTPATRRDHPLDDEDAIGATGLGLDSIAIVELLLDLETAFRIPFPPALFDQGPLTIAHLIAHATRHAAVVPR